MEFVLHWSCLLTMVFWKLCSFTENHSCKIILHRYIFLRFFLVNN